MTDKRLQPTSALPIQSRPIHRDQHSEPAPGPHNSGVEASKSRCADLTGPARQMCYQALYGLST
ncbi:hypothetical protein [Streptomyces hokutonensis]|uniref:hypothetical protein n=1 Tax=Streptomyces hokutonensis TaxID=1306990 RepID=UPI001319EA98|nr:hypothetical protein [Streptomyces hokutonensis]